MDDTEQLPLFGSRKTIQERFEKFHRSHPEVYGLFCRFCDELIRAGRVRNSADNVLHRIRWESAVNEDREFDGYKINNDFTSRYARLWMTEHLKHNHFFALRELRAA